MIFLSLLANLYLLVLIFLLLSALLVLDFHSSTAAAESESRRTSHASSRYAKYFELSRRYWSPDSGRVIECLDHAHKHGWDFGNSLGDFYTVGLEGAGHHMMQSLPTSIPGNHGMLRSYSWCGLCPTHTATAWRLYENATGRNDDLSNVTASKFLVLIRDPVDSWISALRRFWHPGVHSHDTLDRELLELERSMRIMNAELQKVHCSNALYVSYELLTHFPEEHIPVMAHFLGVDADHEGLLGWFHDINATAASQTAAESSQQLQLQRTESSNSNRIGPFPAKCKEMTLEKRLSRFQWPSQMKKTCDESSADCLITFRKQLSAWVHGPLKSDLPSIIPQHPMSYC